jgi:hypothetical protein
MSPMFRVPSHLAVTSHPSKSFPELGPRCCSSLGTQARRSPPGGHKADAARQDLGFGAWRLLFTRVGLDTYNWLEVQQLVLGIMAEQATGRPDSCQRTLS